MIIKTYYNEYHKHYTAKPIRVTEMEVYNDLTSGKKLNLDEFRDVFFEAEFQFFKFVSIGSQEEMPFIQVLIAFLKFN